MDDEYTTLLVCWTFLAVPEITDEQRWFITKAAGRIVGRGHSVESAAEMVLGLWPI